MDLNGKKVLLIGLGILGGGLSMAKYLVKKGAKLTITDLRNEDQLKKMISKLPGNINYVLGKNRISDLKAADIIILNPAVSNFSPLVKKIKELKKEYYNDYTYFLKNVKEKNSNAKIIGITGTRGKTTTTTWTHQFIANSIVGGNIPEAALFKIQDKKTDVFILELSSYQLEHLSKKDRSPNIAIITNVYVDHLNRYKTMNRYLKIKKLIYANQKENDYLIISNDELISREVKKDKPKSKLMYVSLKELPKQKDGLFTRDQKVYFKKGKTIRKIGELPNFVSHEKTNFMFAALAANLYGVEWNKIFKKVKSLEKPIMRQQVIYNKRGLKIVNDSTATTPDAAIAAIEKFKNENLLFITGGTDKNLKFDKIAKSIKKNVRPENQYFLEGSATTKLLKEMGNNAITYENLEDIVDVVSQLGHKGTIVFAPGSASFEKFKNEFDRGQQFNKLVKKYFN